MGVWGDLQYKFKTSSIVQQLIYVNAILFLITLLIGSFSGLYNSKSNFIIEWFSLFSSFEIWITRPWSIITYGFLHGGFFHLLFNCIALYYFGRLFLDYFTPKQLLTFYLLGTFFGGILYMIAYNYFPIFKDQVAPLVGASAGVYAIIIGVATYIPNYQLYFRFIGPVKVWHLAAIFILLDLLQLAGSNGGGHFAHLGGAIFGFLYVSQASNKEIGLFRIVSNIFKTKNKPLKTVYKSPKKKQKRAGKINQDENQKKIDAILDKISKSGYNALSKEEKEFLFKQGKR